MTLITFQNGKPVLRDGKVGTEQECCCDQCCDQCICPEYVDVVDPVLGYGVNKGDFRLVCDGNPDNDPPAEFAGAVQASLINGVWVVSAIGSFGPVDFGVYQQLNDASISCSPAGWLVTANQAWACDAENFCIRRYSALLPCDGDGLPSAGVVDLTLLETDCLGDNWCNNDFLPITVEITRP